MPKCIIDGKEVEFKPGENMVEVAKRGGVEIPVFCYHPALTVVAQCRMCVVEIEKMPKLQTACSTPLTEGMIVHTQSEKVKRQREAIMEFLLLNHPLDCPICDKAGECDLQDNSYKHGSPYMRSTEERRTYLDLDMGPVIQKNMNRCIHCTRCIRFGTEIAGIHEMVAVKRGNNTEITTIDGKELQTEYAGNYSDICPTGSLTLKDFRFHKRAWMLKKTPTVCEGCSRGCNMEIHEHGNQIYRCLPRENQTINKFWLCDEGRFNFHYVHHADRIIDPVVQSGSELIMTDWFTAIAQAKNLALSGKVMVLAGSDLTLEEAKLLKEFCQNELKGAQLHHFGTPGILQSSQDSDADKILKRTSKTANLHGFEMLGIAPFSGSTNGIDTVLVVRGGRATIPSMQVNKKIGIGVFNKSDVKNFSTVLPGASFAEKDGTIVNFQGVEQKLKRAIVPPGKSKLLPEILMIWKNSNQSTGAA